MQTIKNVHGLKNAIQLLEDKQAYHRQLLEEEFRNTYESLKPVNLLKSAVKEIASTPNLVNNVLGATTGLVTGYISKKIVVGRSGNIYRNLLGSILQYGVTNLVAQHPEAIRSVGRFIYQHFQHKKESNSESDD